MGLLDKLWDDVVAGPRPEKGLGWLRKKKQLTVDIPADPHSTSTLDEDIISESVMLDRRRSGEFQSAQDEARRVAEGIAIQTAKLSYYSADESLPSTPSDAGIPQSPSLAASPYFRENRASARRSVFNTWSTREQIGSSKFEQVHPNSPTVHDWVVISVLDR